MLDTQYIDGEVVDSGCDWLTLTARHGDAGLPALRECWAMQMETDVEQHGECKELAPQGYRGLKSRHWFVGERQDGWLFQATSAAAQEAVQIVRGITTDARATRADYQCTIRQAQRSIGHFAAYRGELRSRERATGGATRATVTLYETSNNGDSCLINASDGKRSLLIYDKTAESRGQLPMNLTRFELRTRGQQARETFKECVKSPDAAAYSKSVVAAMLKKLEFHGDWVAAADGYKLPSSYEPSDAERRFKWLMRDVAPLVAAIEDENKRRQLKIAFGFS